MHSFENESSEKNPAVLQPSSGDEDGQPPAILGTVTELHDLTILGYKPELRRNRSMFTLLFQSLAIAAVSASHGWEIISRETAADRDSRYPTASADPSYPPFMVEASDIK
jgi:hypothetical protein